MGTQKSNMFDAPFKYMVPEDKEIPDRPLPSHWTPSMQAYNTSGSTPSPFLNQQAAGSHMPLYMWVNQVNNTLLQSDALHDPRMLSSKPTVAGDFPSTKKQHCNLMLENASSTKLNQDLETGLDASDANAQLVNLEKDEIRRERKRQSNRESARRSRMRKEKECEELHKQMEMLKDENSVLTQRLKSLSEECLEICNENDAIEEELIKMYGPESIADLLLFKPT
ncbi:hypothetical protein AAZX31_20G007000 [Glycine max]